MRDNKKNSKSTNRNNIEEMEIYDPILEKVTPSGELGPQEIFGQFDQNSDSVFTSLSLMGVSLNSESIKKLCDCIQSNPLQAINLSGTLLSAKSWNSIFNTLSNHPTLTTLFLSDCVIGDQSKEAFMALLMKSKTLQYVNIRGHHMTIDNNLMAAIARSANLIHLEMDDALSEFAINHLNQNKQFQDLELYLNEWMSGEFLSRTTLESRKEIFYKIVKAIQCNHHDTYRLNEILAKFNLYLATSYLQYNEKTLVVKYCKRLLQLESVSPHFIYEAHEMLGELFYNEASLRLNHPEQEEDLVFGKKYLLSAYKHFTQAVEFATPENEFFIKNVWARCGIFLGEKLLTEADDYYLTETQLKRDPFQRKYISN